MCESERVVMCESERVVERERESVCVRFGEGERESVCCVLVRVLEREGSVLHSIVLF